ncbi:MAG: aldehyde ferredoxin oxidoreductase family protein [Halobacteriales archaeon]|nr:aldehyde ferredoxin oxidoreductase family protein [Halobacteriales archaeon]
MPGLHGRLLEVDLTRGRLQERAIPEAWAQQHLGGRGLAARWLWEHVAPRAEPLGPDNHLVFAAGPLTGIALPGSGRHCVAARSPLSGLYGEAFAGGFWGNELRVAGWDAIAVHGQARAPVLLSVTDPEGDAPGRAELHPANDLWGQTVTQAEEQLLTRWPKARVASIGPAGENQVRFACIVNDRNRAAGRTGLGAVMGSKKLKAIVVRGDAKNTPPIADDARLKDARKAYIGTLMDEATKGFGELGTPGGIDYLSEFGILPTRYWKEGSWEHAEQVSGETQNKTILVARDNCTACHVRCGMDTISAGSAVAFAMAARAAGKAQDAPAFGDAHGAYALLHDIAHRRGMGATLAEGTKRAAEAWGCPGLSADVKGVELPMHEARGKKGLGLSYAVSPRGANHMEGMHDDELGKDGAAPDLGIVQGMSRFQADAAKAHAVKVFEDARSFVNSLVVCAFTINHTGSTYNLGHARDMVSAATGSEVDRDRMLAIGERNYQLARMLSVRWGLKPEQDTLPKAIRTEPLPFGKRKEALTDTELDAMKRAYYEERGWGEDGAPTSATRARLGLP